MNLQSYATRQINNIESHPATKLMRQVVSIRNPEGSSPLFCVHPSGGDIGIYRKLATRLNPRRSILGLQSRLECGADSELSSLHEMASTYTQIIEMRNPTGPIRLLGFSLGGFLASLIAENLYQSGRTVSFLGLIDSNPGWIDASEKSRHELAVRLTQVFTKFQNVGMMRMKPIEDVRRDVKVLVDTCFAQGQHGPVSPTAVMAKTTAMGYVPDRQLDASALLKFTSTFLTHCRLLGDFQPPRIECPLSLWWPSETEAQNKTGTELWSQVAQSTVTTSAIDGSHYSIMRGSSVRVLAAEIEAAMDSLDD